MNRSIKFILALILVPCCLHADEINWQTDLEKAIQMATQQRKPLMLHCWFEGCGPCRKLEEYVFTNKDIIKAFNENVIPVKVDTINRKDIAERFEIKTVPHDVFLTPGGFNLLSRPSPQSVSEYLDVMKAVGRLYQTQDALVTGGLNHKPLKEELSQFGGAVKQQVNSFTGRTGLEIDRGTGAVKQAYNKAEGELEKYNTDRFFQPSGNGLPVATQAQHVKSDNEAENVSANSYLQNKQQVNQVAHQIQNLESKVVYNPFMKSGANSSPNSQQKMQIHNQQEAKNQSETEINPTIAKTHQEKKFVAPQPKTEVPAFDGYCPVSLQVERKWQKGTTDWGCYHRGRLFLFASEAYLDQFVENPDQFSPALAGYDPVAYAETGKLIDGKRQIGVFYPTKNPLIYVFANEGSKKKFQADPAKFAETVRVATEQCDTSNSTELR